MTELAYLADLPSAYVRAFRARVTALPPGAVVLDRTYFYPAGGGQPSDRGELRVGVDRTLQVVDVVKSGAAVVHRIRGDRTAAGALQLGAEVDGTLDWDRRYRHMRLHTAQHLASARIFARTDLRTRRATLSGAGATIDLEGPLPSGALEEVKDDVRRTVDAPREVTIRTIPRAEWEAHPAAGRSGLVALPAQVDPVRVVEIDATDVCPCGGTHVRSTAEIGGVEWLPTAPGGGDASRVAFTLSDPHRPTPTG